MTNTSTITDEIINHNIKTNHTQSVEDYINSQVDNELIGAKPPVINPEDESLPRGTNRTLAQLRDDRSPFLCSYLNKIDLKNHPSPLCPPLQGRHTRHQTPLLLHSHQNPSETPGSLERTRGSGGAATTVERRLGSSRRQSGDSDLVEVGVVVKNNTTAQILNTNTSTWME